MGVLATRCVDTAPLPYTPTTFDASTDAISGDASWRQACDTCIRTEPACSFSACAADPKCLEFHGCVLDAGCLQYPSLSVRIACGQPCFQKVGLLDFTNPSLQLYYPVNGCTLGSGPCVSACVTK